MKSLFRFSCLVTLLATMMLSLSARAATGITYHGKLVRPDGTPVDGQFVGFRLRLMDGNTGTWSRQARMESW